MFSFIHQIRFYENQKFNFPAEIYKIREKGYEKNCLSQKDLQLWSQRFFYCSYIFCLLMKNIHKIGLVSTLK